MKILIESVVSEILIEKQTNIAIMSVLLSFILSLQSIKRMQENLNLKHPPKVSEIQNIIVRFKFKNG